MGIPGFAAEAALYDSNGSYRGVISTGSKAGVSTVLPQQLILRRMGPITGGQFFGGRMLVAFQCDRLTCTCQGDDDCNDMFSSGVCGDIATCRDGGCWCWRL
jgi:hypothetical protein